MLADGGGKNRMRKGKWSELWKRYKYVALVVLAGILLMLLPIALIFAENSMANLQTVSIIAAFPIGFIIVMIVWSFFKDARHYLDKENSETQNIR